VDNQLPFTVNTTGNGLYTYALIGSDAGPASLGPNGCSDHGCVAGTLAQGWGSGTANFPYLVTPLEAIQERAAENGQTTTFTLNDWNVGQAVATAKSASVAIVFTVADSGEGYITFDGNAGDRNNLSCWNNGDSLIEAVAAVNSHTIVVLHVVGPVLMPWADHPNITAIVVAGLPGQESGHSLADVLFGDVVPSGKLVYTIAQQASDYPAEVLYSSPAPHPQIDYTEGLFIDYRWFDQNSIEPQFEFGFGLTYTTFTYANLLIQAASASAHVLPPHLADAPHFARFDDDPVLYKVQVSITNSGNVAAYEIAQLYLGFPSGTGEPPQVLRGFEKVWIQPGQTVPVVFYLTQLHISIYSTSEGEWVIPKGQFGVFVGASSRDIRLKGSFSQ